MDYSQLLESCNQWKTNGDKAYREGRYQDAIDRYSDIITRMEDAANPNPVLSLPQSLLDILYIAHSNRCASYLRKKEFVPALTDAQRCVQYQPYWAKGYGRLGMCYHKLNRLSEAIAAYEQVLQFEENNLDAKVNIDKIKTQMQKEREAQRQNANRGGNSNSSTGSTGAGASRPFPSSSSSSSTSGSSNRANTTSAGGEGGQMQVILDRIKQTIQEWVDKVRNVDYAGMARSTSYRVSSAWLSIAPETRQYITYGVVGLLLYYFFIYRASSSSYGYGGSGGGGSRRYYDPDMDDDYHYRHSYGYGGGSRGLSWSAWGMIMFAAYKLPPMFPDQLGQYARPFFGMNWTTFMWLLNMFTNGRNMGGLSRGIFGGHRRRY